MIDKDKDDNDDDCDNADDDDDDDDDDELAHGWRPLCGGERAQRDRSCGNERSELNPTQAKQDWHKKGFCKQY